MRSEEEMIAYALEIDPSLLPFVPELLADLDELGSDAELIAKVLGDLDLTAASVVVDLGCGKGAASVEIAEVLGCRVVGIELFEPFVRICEALAHERGVSDRCEFRHGDILKLAEIAGPFDAAVFAALGDTLGGLDATIRAVRRYVRPGGYLVISDVFLKDGGSAGFPGFENYADRPETRRLLESCGDIVVREVRESAEEAVDSDEAMESELIRRRAHELAGRHPELADALLGFATFQAEANEYIAKNLIGAIWVLRRS